MKKTLILTTMIMMVLCTAPAAAKNFNVGIEAGYFGPRDSDFSDAYGSGGTTFGINAGFRFLENVSIQTGIDTYSANGTTALSNERIGIDLKTWRIGSYYHFNLKKVMPKAGAGLSMVRVKEDDPFGGTQTTKTGWFVGTGMDVPLGKKFLAGFDLLYNDAKISGTFDNETIGGLSLLFNLKFQL